MNKTKIDDMLRNSDLKATKPRMRVLSLFIDSKKPLSADDVLGQFQTDTMDSVTVYRTLSVFEQAGLLRKVDLRKDAVCYEMADDHHHHIVCKVCGDLEDFTTCVPDSLLRQIQKESKKFALLEDHSFEFFGLCKKCAI